MEGIVPVSTVQAATRNIRDRPQRCALPAPPETVSSPLVVTAATKALYEGTVQALCAHRDSEGGEEGEEVAAPQSSFHVGMQVVITISVSPFWGTRKARVPDPQSTRCAAIHHHPMSVHRRPSMWGLIVPCVLALGIWMPFGGCSGG